MLFDISRMYQPARFYMPSYRLRFLPRTLLWRIILPLAASLGLGGLGIWFGIETLARQQHQAVVDVVKHIGETFLTLPQGIPLTPNQETGRLLLLANTPPVQRIALLDNRGQSVLISERPPGGAAFLHTDSLRLDMPTTYIPSLRVTYEAVIHWQPVGNKAGQAWLMTEASLQAVNQWRWQMLFWMYAGYAVVCGIALLSATLVARTESRGIIDATRFADSISSEPHARLPENLNSEELQHLVDALNRLSGHWRHRLRLSEQANTHLRAQQLALDAHAAVCITDTAGRIEYANPLFCAASGYESRELLGKNIGILNSGCHADFYFKTLWRTLALGRIWQGALCNRNKRGETYWVHCTISPYIDGSGRSIQYIAIQTTISAPQQRVHTAAQ